MEIGLAGWAIVRRFKDGSNPLQVIDYFSVVKDEFDLDRVELNNVFLASHEPDYLRQLCDAAAEAGVIMEGMAVDGTGDLSTLDAAAREQAVANAMEYFDIAEALGLAYFRVNTGGDPNGPREMLDACVDSFRQLAKEGERRGIRIATENHGGLSTDPEMMVRLVEAVGLPSMATLPDIGNFPEDDLAESIARIMPWACNVHVKWTRRDGDGKRDVPALMKVVKASGFDGTLLIEDGGLVNDHMGVLELKGALIACLNSAIV